MNELEEKYYSDIKEELVQSVIDKKIDTYFTNRNELSHYYNVGKMIIEAQGGEERAKYGNGLIKKFSERLSKELGKGFSIQNLKNMRRFYLFIIKGHAMRVQLTWTHYREVLSLKDDNEINYYIDIAIKEHLSYRDMLNRIKSKEYQRLSDETKNKLINKEEIDVTGYIKNPIFINTFNSDKENISENTLKSFILRDMENFLEQLGIGFAFIKSEYKIIIGNEPNYIDLLLFNIKFNCYVVVELKVVKSNKDHLGQVMVYKNYIDKHVKSINQDKTIGIIVCKQNDKYLIEYSSDSRIKITTYELL